MVLIPSIFERFSNVSHVNKPQRTHQFVLRVPTCRYKYATVLTTICEITNFIRENGDDWDKFCHNTAHPSTTRKTVNTLPPSNQKISRHKNAEIKGTLATELLLQADPHHFVLFPIQHDDIWRMYKKAKASFWTAEEIKLSSDAVDWDGLLTTEQHFILHVLTFFAASGGIVNKNLSSNFATEVTSLETRCFYGFQIAIENFHSKIAPH